MPETAFAQVLGSEARDFSVVHVNEGDAGFRHEPEHIDYGQTGLFDEVGDLVVLDTGDDAVASPSGQPAGTGFLQAAGLMEQGPGAALPHISPDTPQDITSRGEGGFHQQRDMTANHGITLGKRFRPTSWSCCSHSMPRVNRTIAPAKGRVGTG